MKLTTLFLFHFSFAMEKTERLQCTKLDNDGLANLIEKEHFPHDFLHADRWDAFGVGRYKRIIFNSRMNKEDRILRYDIWDYIVEKQFNLHFDLIPQLQKESFFPYEARCYHFEETLFIIFSMKQVKAQFSQRRPQVVTVPKLQEKAIKIGKIFQNFQAKKTVFLRWDDDIFYETNDGNFVVNPLSLAFVYRDWEKAYCSENSLFAAIRLSQPEPTSRKNEYGESQVILTAHHFANAFSFMLLVERMVKDEMETASSEALAKDLENYHVIILAYRRKMGNNFEKWCKWENVESIVSAEVPAHVKRPPPFSHSMSLRRSPSPDSAAPRRKSKSRSKNQEEEILLSLSSVGLTSQLPPKKVASASSGQRKSSFSMFKDQTKTAASCKEQSGHARSSSRRKESSNSSSESDKEKRAPTSTRSKIIGPVDVKTRKRH